MFLQHHPLLKSLQKYQFDDLRKDTDTSVSKKMFVVCNTFHGTLFHLWVEVWFHFNNLPSFANVLSFNT